ncbi:MAG TPA: IS66 family transposase zinc-finger binding domain-containing protein [Micromonosporaceae bacterium]|nr:IS66 family transposase zinc-finger binding domain-containing protein [Micromonosporaceae bacterium]
MLVDDPDETHERAPQVCGGCGHDLAGAEELCRQHRQVVDLPAPPKPHVTEYQVVSLACPCCGAVSAGQAPDGVTGRVQYGPGVKARLAYLRGAQFLPFGRAVGALAVLGGLRVVPATVLAATLTLLHAGGRRKADIDAGSVLADSPGSSLVTATPATTTCPPPCTPSAVPVGRSALRAPTFGRN